MLRRTARKATVRSLTSDQKNFKKAIEFKGFVYYSAEYLRNEQKWKLLFKEPAGSDNDHKTFYIEATTAMHMLHQINRIAAYK